MNNAPTAFDIIGYINSNSQEILARLGDNGIYSVYGMDRTLNITWYDEHPQDKLDEFFSNTFGLTKSYNLDDVGNYIVKNIENDMNQHIDALTEVFNSRNSICITMQMFCAGKDGEMQAPPQIECGLRTNGNIFWKVRLQILGKKHDDESRAKADDFVNALREIRNPHVQKYDMLRQLSRSKNFKGTLTERIVAYNKLNTPDRD